MTLLSCHDTNTSPDDSSASATSPSSSTPATTGTSCDVPESSSHRDDTGAPHVSEFHEGRTTDNLFDIETDTDPLAQGSDSSHSDEHDEYSTGVHEVHWVPELLKMLDASIDNSSAPGKGSKGTWEENMKAKMKAEWPNKNWEIISQFCNSMCMADRDFDVFLACIRQLDSNLSIPVSIRELRRAEERIIRDDFKMEINSIDIDPPKTSSGQLKVENVDLRFIHLDLLEAVSELLRKPVHRKWLHFQFEGQFSVDGEALHSTIDIHGNRIQSHDERIYSKETPVPRASADYPVTSNQSSCEKKVYMTDEFDHVPSEMHRGTSELWTTDWFREQQEATVDGHGNIFVPIIASDETCVTMTGRKWYPIYCWSGNYHGWFHEQPSGWTLLGFLPVVRPVKAFKNDPAVRAYRRAVKRFCMGELFRTFREKESGFVLKLKDFYDVDYSIWVYPRFPWAVGDEPELQSTYIGTYATTTSRCPCTLCDVEPKEAGLMKVGEIRDVEAVRALFDRDTETSRMTAAESRRMSLHRDFNWMYFVAGYNPFLNPPCLMHQTDHGIFKLLIGLVVKFVTKYCGSACLQRFDERWTQLKSFPGSKKFPRGVSTLTFVTAGDHRAMSIGLPFVLRGLTPKVGLCKSFWPPRFLEDLSVTYIAWRWLLGQRDVFFPMRMKAISILGEQLQKKLDHLHFVVHGQHILYGNKFHKICHWPTVWIPYYGMPKLYNGEYSENSHVSIKKWKGKMNYISDSANSMRLLRVAHISDVHCIPAAAEDSEIISSKDMSVMPTNIVTVDRAMQLSYTDGATSRSTTWSTTAGSGFRVSANRTDNIEDRRGRGWVGDTNESRKGTTSRQKNFGSHGFRGEVIDMSSNWKILADTYVIDGISKCEREYASTVSICGNDSTAVANAQDVLQAGREYYLKSGGDEGYVLNCILNVICADSVIAELLSKHKKVATLFSQRDTSTTTAKIHSYKKFWCAEAECYIVRGMCVAYSSRDSPNANLSIGCVKEILTLLNQQVIVVQRFKDVPYEHGPLSEESAERRHVRQQDLFHFDGQSENSCQLDPLKLHFWYQKALPPFDLSSYHVILGDSNLIPFNAESTSKCKFKIEHPVMIQPDFDANESKPRYFLVQYII